MSLNPTIRPGISPEDVKAATLDGEPQIMMSSRGVAVFTYLAWAVDGKPEGKKKMRLYCQYISMRGYRGGATKAMEELGRLSPQDGKAWVEKTHDEFVTDGLDMVRYMYGDTLA